MSKSLNKVKFKLNFNFKVLNFKYFSNVNKSRAHK